MPEPETYQKMKTGTSLGEKNRIPWEEIHHAAQGSKLRDLGGRDAYVFFLQLGLQLGHARENV